MHEPFPDQRPDWLAYFYIPGEDWGDENGFTVNFAVDPDTNEFITQDQIDDMWDDLEWSSDIWRQWNVYLHAGKLVWYSTFSEANGMPFCDVSDWEGDFEEPTAHLGRLILCYWDCG